MSGSGTSLRRVYAYRLGFADALAWETAPRELAGWRLVAFVVWVGLAGAVLAALPESRIGEPWSLRFVILGAVAIAAFWAAAILWWNVLARRRARRRFPAPVDATLEEWSDCLRERLPGGETVVRPADIAAVVSLPGHVVVATPERAVIVPLSAFADPDDMAAFAERWDAASRAATP